MDSRLLGFIIGVLGTLMAIILGRINTTAAVVSLVIGLIGFVFSTYEFLKPSNKFKPLDPYSFHWRPVAVLIALILIAIYIVPEVL